MRALFAPFLRPLLRRDPGEIVKRSSSFQIKTGEGRQLVSRLGAAFIGGYNAMLAEPSLAKVAEEGRSVAPHFQPFFFEGAAMGYLPRGYLSPGFTAATAERDLLEMDPRFRYLYYVGLGFWFGMRYPRRPAELLRLAPSIDPLYLPLCFDGFGFKTAFFDYPKRPGAAWAVLEDGPAAHRAALHQGFGRALFFVQMDDEPEFCRLRDRLAPQRRTDLETGRSLALAFTGTDHPSAIARHLADSRDEAQRAARLLGVTWALTAREMNDPVYFARCMSEAPPGLAEFLRLLPGLCREALAAASDYAYWQTRTRAAVLEAYPRYAPAIAT